MPPGTLNETASGVVKPLAIDLCCGLGGWTEGLLAEGYRVRGYDIEAHEYGDEKYPAKLVLKSILDLHGSEVADADLIVASPPCQEFSYMAMPWGLAKAKAAAIRADETGEALAKLTALFDACFRIQREACAAAGRYIPMVVENVKGAQPWVGRAHWHFGSYYLWGDIPALMPIQKYHQRLKVKAGEQSNVSRENFTGTRGWDEGLKNTGGSWFNIGSPGQRETGRNPVHALAAEGIKNRDADGYERTHPNAFGWKIPRTSSGSRGRKALAEGTKVGGDDFFANGSEHMVGRGGPGSMARKAASAKIAKIPFALSSHIARVYRPTTPLTAEEIPGGGRMMLPPSQSARPQGGQRGVGTSSRRRLSTLRVHLRRQPPKAEPRWNIPLSDHCLQSPVASCSSVRSISHDWLPTRPPQWP